MKKLFKYSAFFPTPQGPIFLHVFLSISNSSLSRCNVLNGYGMKIISKPLNIKLYARMNKNNINPANTIPTGYARAVL